MFNRTPSGLNNMHRFHRVDVIVYTEGQKKTADDYCDDECFWFNIFKVFRPDIKIKIQNKGSKKNLLPLARQVQAGSLLNSIVCMDADFDKHKENYELFNHFNVLYTLGYSWENDIWNFKSFLRAVKFVKRKISGLAQVRTLYKLYKSFLGSLKSIAVLDFALSLNGKGFVNRTLESGGIALDTDKKQVSIASFSSLVRKSSRNIRIVKKEAIHKAKIRISGNYTEFLYGHAYCWLHRQLINCVTRRIDENFCKGILFDELEKNKNFLSSHVRNHYIFSLNRIIY